MLLNTKHFGEIEITEEEIIHFPDGIPGFEEWTKYIIIENPEKEVPFHWLQAVENPNLAFVIINPFIFKKNYDFELPQSTVEKLKIEKSEDVAVFSIVVVPEDINKMTANLLAPIIINTKNKMAKQVLLEDDRYHTKHCILEEIKSAG